MLAVQSEVIAVIFEPETPGGLRLSIDCRTESSSATADDIVYHSCLQQASSQMLQECTPSR